MQVVTNTGCTVLGNIVVSPQKFYHISLFTKEFKEFKAAFLNH